MRSITAGFRMWSVGGRRAEEKDTRCSARGWTGLRGVSALPSMLAASSLRVRTLGSTIRSPVVMLSRLALPERLGLGAVSAGLLILLRPEDRLGASSTRADPPRLASISIMPWTVTGARAAFAVVATAVFAIFGRFWTLGEGVFGADVVVIDDALEDSGAVVCDSEVMPPADEKPDVGMSDDVAESKVEFVAPLSPRGSGDVFAWPGAVLTLFLEEAPS